MTEPTKHDEVLARLTAAHAHTGAQHEAIRAAVDEHLAGRIEPATTPPTEEHSP